MSCRTLEQFQNVGLPHFSQGGERGVVPGGLSFSLLYSLPGRYTVGCVEGVFVPVVTLVLAKV